MEHLPECPTDGVRCSDGSLHGPFEAENSGRCLRCGGVCICGALRACEQRVMQDAKEWEANAYIIGLKVGTNKALDAAEQTVADIGIDFPFDIHDVPTYGKKVLAAIRGLREEK